MEIPSSDICIVGTGAAGLEIARHFNNTPLSITLLEAGFDHFDWRTQRLYNFEQIGHKIRGASYDKPFDFNVAKQKEFRLRQYGGTLNIWSGRWKLLEPYDFTPKPGIQETGWPLSYDEIYRYYRLIAEDYDLTDLLNLTEKSLISEKFKYLKTIISYGEIPPLNIKEKYDKQVQDSSNIRLVLGANVVNIALSEDLTHVDHLTVKSIDGLTLKVKSKNFILACGAVENARLLLCSNKQIKSGIGNKNDLIGRNLIDHPKGAGGVIYLSNNKDKDFNLIQNNKLYRIEFGMKQEMLQKLNLPNHHLYIRPQDSSSNSNLRYVSFYLEQLPNLESRLFLTNERDELDMPIVCLDWKFREEDKIGLKKFVDNMKILFSINNIGKLIYDESIFEMHFVKDSSHQMGTTRMAADEKNGAVDMNCKVFGIDNLYISGCSVFPVGGIANPTMTIIALARRLALHLKNKYNRG